MTPEQTKTLIGHIESSQDILTTIGRIVTVVNRDIMPGLAQIAAVLGEQGADPSPSRVQDFPIENETINQGSRIESRDYLGGKL